jgi:hypothetical protein
MPMHEIITFGKGYTLNPGIKVFVQSAKHVPNTQVTIISIDLADDLVFYLKSQGVNVVDGKELATKHNVNLNISPYTLKVIFFRLYCKHYTEAEKLYLCDFTDIYFQRKDLFDIVSDDKVVYVSSEKQLIKNCQTNTTWLNVCYNSDITRLLESREILNGGTILGYKTPCLELLDEMCKDMSVIIGRIGNYQNIDQASLNKCVYFDLPRFNILKNNEILNCAHQGNLPVTPGINYNIGGYEPYVIHQYDVIKSLESDLYKIFY